MSSSCISGLTHEINARLMTHITFSFLFFFFFCTHACARKHARSKYLFPHPEPPRRCLERMCCWMKEPPCVSLTCVCVCVSVCAREWLAMPGQADSAPQQPWLSVFSLCQPTDYCCSHCCQCGLSNGDTTDWIKMLCPLCCPCLTSSDLNITI